MRDSRARSRAPKRSSKLSGQTLEPVQALEMARRSKPAKLGRERRRREDLQGPDELQLLEIAGFCAPVAVTIGAVIVLGLDQLDGLTAPSDAADQIAALKLPYKSADAGLGSEAEKNPHFLERWRDAMCFELGADEVQKVFVALSLRAAHGQSRAQAE